jgi:hypothetical protein
MITNFKWTGHSAVLHGCTVEDEAFVGTGATLLDGVCVEKHAMVAAGALVRQNTRIPSGEVCEILVDFLDFFPPKACKLLSNQISIPVSMGFMLDIKYG